jgi:hypothetical protein
MPDAARRFRRARFRKAPVATSSAQLDSALQEADLQRNSFGEKILDLQLLPLLCG